MNFYLDIFQLLSTLCFGAVIVSGIYFYQLKSNNINKLYFNQNIIIGLVLGILCFISVASSYHIDLPYGATTDFRGSYALMSGIFGGPVAAIITNSFGAIARYFVIGGPVAIGGVVGFFLYCFASILGYYILKIYKNVKWYHIVIFGLLSTIMVVPAFFISVSYDKGFEILQNALPVLLISNLVGTLIFWYFVKLATHFLKLLKTYSEFSIDYKKLATVVANTSDAVIITDINCYIIWVNKSFEKMTGYSFEEVNFKKPSFLQGFGTNQETVKYINEKLQKKRRL